MPTSKHQGPSCNRQKYLAEHIETVIKATIVIISSPVSIERQDSKTLVMIIYPQFQNLTTKWTVKLSKTEKLPEDNIITTEPPITKKHPTGKGWDHQYPTVRYAWDAIAPTGERSQFSSKNTPTCLEPTPKDPRSPWCKIKKRVCSIFCHAKHITIPNLWKNHVYMYRTALGIIYLEEVEATSWMIFTLM